MGSRRASSAIGAGGACRLAHITLVVLLPALMLLHGCAGAFMVFIPMLGAGALDNASMEAALKNALAKRDFEFPFTVVCTQALVQAAQRDGRSIASGNPKTGRFVVSYSASSSTGAAAGSLAVRCYASPSSGEPKRGATTILVSAHTGTEEDGRKVAEQLLDAVAADLATGERQSATNPATIGIAALSCPSKICRFDLVD